MDGQEKVLEVKDLSKRYKKTLAVDRLSFEIGRGEILGLIGANGAGKTTTIAMLLGLVIPTGGRISIFGLDPKRHRRKVLLRMNFSSPYVSLPHRLSVRENLSIYADLYGVRDREKSLNEVCGQLEITELLGRRYGELSSGQKTRVAMAKALLNRPDLILLDEPTASLDPDVSEKVRSCLHSYREARGAAILISSHNMQEVERVCDRVVILKKGRSIAEGRPGEVISRYGLKDLEEVFIDIVRKEEVL
jgi:ABC-2 type transport system ATP-binding protein